jgi:putative membrane protein
MSQKPFTVLGVAVAIVFGLSLRAEDGGGSDFLLDAIRTDIAEVQMAKLAEQHAESEAVRDYAKRLQADHSRALQEASALALTLSAQVPTEADPEALAHYDALEQLSGRDFDAAFVSHMIAGHEAAIEKFGTQSRANPNGEVATLAAKTLPMLRAHLTTAQSLQAGEARHSHEDPRLPR